MEMAKSVGRKVPYGIPVVWHSSGEVDVFLPYEDERWHADPHMDENPLRMPRCHAMDDLMLEPHKYLHLGPAIPKTIPGDYGPSKYDDQVGVESGSALTASSRPAISIGVTKWLMDTGCGHDLID
jgi:hypothetical protein